jgi:hypothetical protein
LAIDLNGTELLNRPLRVFKCLDPTKQPAKGGPGRNADRPQGKKGAVWEGQRAARDAYANRKLAAGAATGKKGGVQKRGKPVKRPGKAAKEAIKKNKKKGTGV